MILIGITGSIASGKSTFAAIFKELGAKVIDADKVGHSLYKNPAIKTKLVETFGDEIIDKNGKIDRTTLGNIVFSDKRLRRKLDNIMQRPLSNALKEEIAKVKKANFPGIFAIDAALLPKWNTLLPLFDFIIFIEVPKWQQMNRLIDLGLSQEAAERRVITFEGFFDNFQSNVDYLIRNSGTMEEFRIKAIKVWLDIKKETKRHKSPVL